MSPSSRARTQLGTRIQWGRRWLTHLPEDGPRYRSRYWDRQTKPIHPFGFGLCYTTFECFNLQVSTPQVNAGECLTIRVDKATTGQVAGDGVAQPSIHQKWGSNSRHELTGFERSTPLPGEAKTVTFALGPDELTYWSMNAGQWIQDVATFELWVGGDSLASLGAEFAVIA